MQPYTILLGTAQDGGIPHVGCRQLCCLDLDTSRHRLPCCLAIVDPESGQRWLIDCTPEFPRQLRRLDAIAPPGETPILDGILLTHAHIGHYAGLVSLGTEALATDRLPLFAMPKMRGFLENNEPWNRLIRNHHVELKPLADSESRKLNTQIEITPLTVPHRDEFSETAAFVIRGPKQSVLYLPDIDGWDLWSTKIEDVIADVDTAYIDGTFFDAAELPGRNQAAIPHPRIADSLKRFASLPSDERAKIRFLHFNHTNPAANPRSEASRLIAAAGMRAADESEILQI